MIRMRIVSRVLTLFLLAAPGYVGAAQTYFVYVAAESEDTVALVAFDGVTAEVVKTIPVGTLPTEIEGPHGLSVSPDGQFWYVTLAHGQPFGKVVKYSTGADLRVGEVELDLFPATMHISRQTGLLFVVNFNLHGAMEPNSVSVVDPATMVEVARTTTGVMPHGSRLSPDGRKHYSVAMMSGELIEMDALDFTISRRMNVGVGPSPKPTWVEPHPTQPLVYVANNGGDEIVEVNLEQWTVSRRFAAEGSPYNLALTPDGDHILASLKARGATGIFDAKTGEEIARIANTRALTHGVAISPDGRYAFVSVEGIGGEPGSVDVIDLAARRLVAFAAIGRQAGGIAFWKMIPGD